MRIWFASLIFSLVSVIACAENRPVQVYAIALAYRLDEAGTKHYNKLLDEFAEKGLRFNVLVRPLKRSILYLKADARSCLFPTTINAVIANTKLTEHANLVMSDPIDQVSLRVLTDESKPVITRLDQLNGKRIAILNGLSPETLLAGISANIEKTSDESIRVKMLNAGRLDAIVSFTPDVLLAAEDLGLPVPHFHEELALLRNEGASMVCHDTPENRVFLKEFNRILQELKSSGELRKVLGKYAVLAP